MVCVENEIFNCLNDSFLDDLSNEFVMILSKIKENSPDKQLSSFHFIFIPTKIVFFMDQNSLDKIIQRSLEIREKYHQLEIRQNGKEWTLEQDALAFLTDAGLVGRDVMSHEKTWTKPNSAEELEHKLAENIWWLIILADRTGIDIKEALEKFLIKTENILK